MALNDFANRFVSMAEVVANKVKVVGKNFKGFISMMGMVLMASKAIGCFW